MKIIALTPPARFPLTLRYNQEEFDYNPRDTDRVAYHTRPLLSRREVEGRASRAANRARSRRQGRQRSNVIMDTSEEEDSDNLFDGEHSGIESLIELDDDEEDEERLRANRDRREHEKRKKEQRRIQRSNHISSSSSGRQRNSRGGNHRTTYRAKWNRRQVPLGLGTSIERSWIQRDGTNTDDHAKYCPQVGDKVVYFPQGHMESLQLFAEDTSPPWLSFADRWPLVLCVVKAITYGFPTETEHAQCSSALAVLSLGEWM